MENLIITLSVPIVSMLACLRLGSVLVCQHGWLGDAQVTAEEALLNFNMAPIYTSFLQTILDSQKVAPAATAGDVAPVVPTSEKLLTSSTSSSSADRGSGIADISWTAAYPLITRWMLKFHDDKRLAAKHYPHLVEYISDLLNHTTQGSDGLVSCSAVRCGARLFFLLKKCSLFVILPWLSNVTVTV